MASGPAAPRRARARSMSVSTTRATSPPNRNNKMTKTISRLYNSYDRAAQAVRDLEAAGVPHSDISIVANNSDNWYSSNGGTTGTTKRVDPDRDGVDDRAEGAGKGAGIGAGVGGAAGLLAGLGLLAIPG